jgi:hypothetical protein
LPPPAEIYASQRSIEHSDFVSDHGSLTLTNRCRGGGRAKQNGAGKSRAVKKP